jgi:hypothetical protein
MADNLSNAFNSILSLIARPATIERLGGSEVVSGFIPQPSANLVSSVSAGVAYIKGNRVSVQDFPMTYAANKDTYFDVGMTGIIYTIVNNGDPTPALFADTLRLAKVVTDATSITAITFLAKYKSLYAISPTPIKIASANSYKTSISLEETAIFNGEFVISKSVLDAVNFPNIKRGDRILDSQIGANSVTEVIEMMGFGGIIIGYRIRCG